MDKKELIKTAIPIILLVIFSMFMQAQVISDSSRIKQWLESTGPLLIPVYILAQTITLIIPPLSGVFVYVAVLAILGVEQSLLLWYLVSIPCYMINFYIARKYGRPAVEKFVGKKALKQVDQYVEDAGLTSLIIIRIFQGGIFDYISYAVGLSKLSARTFLIVNILGGIPSTFISYIVLTRVNDFTWSVIASLVVSAILSGVSILLNLYLKGKIKIN